MTGRAVRQLGCGANIPFRCEFLADFRLVRRRFPIHVENLIQRAKRLLRIAVALDAPLHQQGRRLEYERHLIDLAVTRGAAHSFVDMNAVIEIDEIRQPVNLHPLDGLVGAIALPHGLEVISVVEEHRVAVHAGLCGGDTRDGRGFYARVTVSAVDAIVADVVFVAELHRLLARDILIRGIGRASDPQHSRECEPSQKYSGEHTESRDEIRAAVKNLGHVIVAL
jgi:hypothetical protein